MNAVLTAAQWPAAGGKPHRLQVASLSKTFGAIRVLRGVQMAVAPGELHGLVGQNGCGKSTLVKILTGMYRPDPGAAVTVDGQPLSLPVHPLEARTAGLSVVHQNLGLVDDRTIWENVRLGRYQASPFSRRINRREEQRAVTEALARLGLDLDVTERVGELAAEARAAVAIARAIQDHKPGGGLIIFDESTRAMTKKGRERFFDLVESVTASGASVLLISHQLEEVVQHADRVTVLRDGQVVQTGIRTKETDEAGLTRLMLGRHVVTQRRAASRAQADLAASVRGLMIRPVNGFDLDLKKGEIVGLTGLAGSGAVAVAEVIGGARPARAGVLSIGGRDLSLAKRHASTADFIASGVAFVAGRRLEEGLAAEMTVTENLTLPRVRSRGKALHAGRGWQVEETLAMMDKLDIRPRDPRKTVGTLSGGNQQKVLLGKWLAGQPRVLVLQEPTQAVDVGARHDIIGAIREAAGAGAGVIVSSVDTADLAVLCDRVLIFRGGQVAAELSGQLAADDIIHATFGAPVAGRSAVGRHREPRHHTLGDVR